MSADPKDESLNRNWLANLLYHELGHLMGLPHADEFVNHPIPVRLPDQDRTPNFMSQFIAFKKTLGFVEFQRLLVLGPGEGQGLPAIPVRKLRSPALPGAGEAPQRLPGARRCPGREKWPEKVKQGNPRTFNNDDEEDKVVEKKLSAVNFQQSG